MTTITWTATDIFGNQTVKTQKVTVVDTERPVLTVPANVSVTVAGGAVVGRRSRDAAARHRDARPTTPAP